MRAILLALPAAMALLPAPALAQSGSSSQDIGDILGDILEQVLTDAVGGPQPAPDSTVPAPALSSAANPMTEAADEFVTETMPFDADRLGRVDAGQIWPSCFTAYPDVEVIVGQQGHGMDPAETREMKIAVDSAYVRQNLVHLGLDQARAKAWADRYTRDRRSFDALPTGERNAVFDGGRSPGHVIAASLNRGNGPDAVLPPIQDPDKCGQLAFHKQYTPYRLVPRPSSGRVFVLPRFGFRLCELRGGDPYNRAQCPDWIEVGGQSAQLMGRYAVAAEWTDGRRSRGTRDFAYVDRSERTVELVPDGG